MKHLYKTQVWNGGFKPVSRSFRRGGMPEGSTNSEDTKKRLIEAAGEVFARNGFRASTVRQICKRARANIGSVNYHFRDKKGLYAATFAYTRQLAFSKYPPDLGLPCNPQPRKNFAHIFTPFFCVSWLKVFLRGMEN